MIAFVFPGQGAQYVGMGVALAEASATARRVFDQASAAIDLDVLALCRDGPEERLRETEFTQPAILTCSWAVASVLVEAGLRPSAAAGLSLGEYTALVAAGALEFTDAVRVVRLRGRFMQEAAGGGAAMAAVMGLAADRVAEVCRGVRGFVEAVNFNAPGQVVIAGDEPAVADAAARLREAGARRVVPLAVSAPFHTSRMQPAAARLAPVLEAVAVRPARIPVVANVSARPVREPVEIRAALVAQVAAPVRWEETVRVLAAMGVRGMVEAGPGTTLAGLVRRTAPDVTVLSAGDPVGVDAVLAALGQDRARAGAGG